MNDRIIIVSSTCFRHSRQFVEAWAAEQGDEPALPVVKRADLVKTTDESGLTLIALPLGADISTYLDVPAREPDLQAFWRAQAEWSEATFGSTAERGPTGPLKHLAKEAAEAQAAPGDISEFADLILLTFDATRRAGFTFEQLRDAAWAKLEVNKARKWTKPTKGDDAVEHVRD